MDNKKPTIYILGSFVMGLTIQVPRMTVIGETLIGRNFNIGPGGKGVNQAIAPARAGGNVTVSVCISDDLFGKEALKTLKKEKLNSSSIRVISNSTTGCGFVTLLENGENSIIIDPGANLLLTPGMIEKEETTIKDSQIVMAQLEVLDDTVETAMKLGKKHSAITILNPAPAREISQSILEYVDILTPNETEAKILLGLNLDDDYSIEHLAFQLLNLGVKTIVMTCGEKGAMISEKSGVCLIKAPKIDTVDTTGAGDSFNGNLAIALAKGLSIKKAVERAVYAGAYCTQKLGVIDGLPTEDELDNYIKILTSK